jgi:hypothetical protein
MLSDFFKETELVEEPTTDYCEECNIQKKSTKSASDESSYYGDIHCHNHIKDYCAKCQLEKPNIYQGRYFQAFCSNCSDSMNTLYVTNELSERMHNKYCDKNYHRCNYGDEYCVYYHSVSKYSSHPENKYVQDIYAKCKTEILKRKNFTKY